MPRSRSRRRGSSGRDGQTRTPAPAAPATPASRILWVRRPICLVVIAALFVLVWMAMGREVTWYLAVDQFGYVTFANDLLSGTVFHDWPPAKVLAGVVPQRTDMLAQTYIWEDGHLYSRYAPGFPILLATWLVVFGDTAAHYLNPLLFIALLGLVVAIHWEVHRSLWRGAAAAALVFVCPTLVHLWGLTLTRDMSAHVFGYVGLVLLLTRYRPLTLRRTFAAGLAIGFAGTIRPDAVMYLVPAGIIATWRWAKSIGGWGTFRRLAASGALGTFLGLLPSLIFYGATTGNPLVPTQAMELKRLLSRATPSLVTTAVAAPASTEGRTDGRVGFPSGGWKGGTVSQVQGGGLRLSNLRYTLWGNWQKIRYAYGNVLVGAALWGIVVAAIMRPMLAVAGVSYLVVAILFFSCWVRPDSRYLIGVWAMIPIFMVEGFAGTLDLVRWLWRRQLHEVARGVAVVAGVAILTCYALLGPAEDSWRGSSWMPELTMALVGLGAGTAIVASLWPHRRVAMLAAPLLMLTATGIAGAHAEAKLQRQASFQRPQSERARATFQAAVDANGVVITSESIGRPMENIEYYGRRNALYLTDLKRWRVDLAEASRALIGGGLRPYLLLQRSTVRTLLPELRAGEITPQLVVDIPPNRNYDFFVAAPFHRGLDMQLWRLTWPRGEAIIEELKRRAR